MSIRKHRRDFMPAASVQKMPRGITCFRSIALESLFLGAGSVRGDDGGGDDAISELAASIAASGLIEPIVVRHTEAGHFEVMAGGRRLAAARLLALQSVPCVVRDCTSGEALLISLTENLQRKDLSPIEKAHGLKRLLHECQLTQEEVGKRLGMSQSGIAHYLRLLELPEKVRNLIHKGELSVGHAKILAGIKDESQLIDLAIDCVSNSRSVRELESAVATLTADAKGWRHRVSRRSREEVELPNGLFLVIKDSPNKHHCGTIEIPFWSEQEKQWAIAVLAEAGSKRTSVPSQRANRAAGLRATNRALVMPGLADGLGAHRDAALIR